MAQALLDALTGVSTIDNQTVLAVQSLLESQTVNSDSAATTALPVDEDDVFQCGKCKKSFNCLQLFMGHKKTCVPPPSQTITISQTNPDANSVSTALTSSHPQPVSLSTQPNIQFPNSPISNINQSLVLSEADLLSLNLDSSNNLQNLLPQQLVSPSASTQVQQQLLAGNLTTSISNGQQPILVNNFNGTVSIDPSGALTVSDGNNEVTAFVVKQPVQDVQNTVESQKIAETEIDKNEVTELNEKLADSTVNIINEFHSSMVKQRKRSASNKNYNSNHSLSNEESTPEKCKLKCAYCDKVFAKNFDLQQHIRSHTGEKPFQCIVCGRAFAQKSNVKKHMQSHKVWPEGISSTLPKDPLEKKMQEVEKVDEAVSPDEKSQSSNTTVAGISVNATYDGTGNVHIVVDNSYVCQYCNFNGKTYTELKSHMKIHRMEKVYKCVMKECGQTFAELDPYLEHIKTHDSEMEYCCHLCHKKFPSLYDLGMHQYSHSLYPNQGPRPGPKYYRCVKCMNKYATASALEHHMTTTSHSYPCTKCSKVFPCERYLRRHLLVHGTVTPHKCQVCSKFFKSENYLKLHMLIHTGEKPFQCLICEKSFNRKDKLKRHNLIHVPFKRFKCPFRVHTGCMKEFNRPDKLKSHILTHSGMKPFKCKKCPRHFSRRSHLQNHERFHENDSGFKCDKCEKNFSREHLLKRHKCDKTQGDEDDNTAQEEVTNCERESQNSKKRKRGRPRRSRSDSSQKNSTGSSIETSSKLVEVHLDITNKDFEASTGNEPMDYMNISKEIPLIAKSDDANLENQEQTAIMVTSADDHTCSNDCLHLHLEQSQVDQIVVERDKENLSNEDIFDQSGNSHVAVIEGTQELIYSQGSNHFTLVPVRNELKSQETVQLDYPLEQFSTGVVGDHTKQVGNLELTYERKEDFIQFGEKSLNKNEDDSLQHLLEDTGDQHFTIIQTDENGKVKSVDYSPVILQMPPDTNS